jgi:tetratricopeptide (TPR) repeat protein
VLREDLPNTRAFLVFDDAHEGTREGLAAFRLLKDVVADVADIKVLILTRESLPFYDRRDVALRGLVREIDLEGLGPQEIGEFLSERPGTPSLAEIAHDLGGHPLFLELLRSSGHSLPSQALGDIRRFVEEEVYSNISDAERTMMKLVSLYRVPVPRDSLFADSGMSHEILMRLVNRSLIRAVGEGRFEAHDAIREFFATVVTPSEQRELGGFAVTQLRGLAEEAEEAGDSVACIDSLSNALELVASKNTRADLLEALGDAHERISALSPASAAYREALQVTSDPETIARLYRKTAEQHHWLWDVRDVVEKSFEQIEAGLTALGNLSSVERGWLYLLRAHLEGHQGRYGRLKEDAEAALGVFRSFGVVAGEVSALEELAEAAAYEGDGSRAERYDMSALELIDSRWVSPPPTAPSWARTRPVQAAHAHGMMMQILLRRGKVDEAARHADAVAGLIDEIDSPHERLDMLMRVSWFKSAYEVDLPTGERYCREALALATQVHDESFVAVAENSLAFYPYFRGEIDEARRGFERAFDAFMAQGRGGSACEPLYMLAECRLLQGDIEAFRRAVMAFDDPSIQGEVGLWTSVIKACQGLDRLLAGDRAGFREAFAVSLQSADESIVSEREAGGYMVSRRVRWGDSIPLLHMGGPLPYVAGSVPHLYYGAALAAIGEEEESKEHFDRVLQVLRTYSHKARLAVASDRQRRLAEVLRDAVSRP